MDCFATSTPWEYDLFETDDAVSPADRDDGALHLIDASDTRQLLAEPTPTPADTGLDGWLSPNTPDLTEEH